MYICENGIMREMTVDEERAMLEESKKLESLYAELDKNRPPTLEEEVATLKKDNETLTQCILEMSMLVYK